MYFERNRQQYYDLLMAISQKSVWREWLVFFLRGVQEQSFDAAQNAKKLQDLQLKWRGQLQQARASALLLQLADSLFEAPVISVSSAEKQLKVSNRTARQYVEKLLDLDILNQFGEKNYARLYFAPAIFEIFP